MKTYLLTGGTGLMGQAIIETLLAQQQQIIVLTRDVQKARKRLGQQITAVTQLDHIAADQSIDCVINLAGAPIADKRWTPARKQVLRDSRITLTQHLIDWLTQHPHKPEALISGSAIGWYGNQQDRRLTEDSDFQDDFAHQLCADWEQTAQTASGLGIRVAIVRTGLVLAAKGGFLQRLLPPFRLGLGGPIASGQQYLSWIHLADIRNLFLFLAEDITATGVFNGTAPNPVTNAIFTRQLATVLNRPARLRIPAVVLKFGLGELSELLLGGQHVLPEKAQAAGFKFIYTDLHTALADILKHRNAF